MRRRCSNKEINNRRQKGSLQVLCNDQKELLATCFIRKYYTDNPAHDL